MDRSPAQVHVWTADVGTPVLVATRERSTRTWNVSWPTDHAARHSRPVLSVEEVDHNEVVGVGSPVDNPLWSPAGAVLLSGADTQARLTVDS